jgi:hypothetical protein
MGLLAGGHNANRSFRRDDSVIHIERSEPHGMLAQISQDLVFRKSVAVRAHKNIVVRVDSLERPCVPGLQRFQKPFIRCLDFSFTDHGPAAREACHAIQRVLNGSILCNQHHAEPCLALHHASVSIGSLFERSCLDHRADILQDAECKGILTINRRTG